MHTVPGFWMVEHQLVLFSAQLDNVFIHNPQHHLNSITGGGSCGQAGG